MNSFADLDPPPFGWPELDEVRRHQPAPYLDGAAWVALWQAELASPGALHRWHLGRVHALVLLMETGWEPEPIEVVGRVIVDGNHRAASARALGRPYQHLRSTVVANAAGACDARRISIDVPPRRK